MKSAVFLIFVLVLSACEGKFPGERVYSLTELSGPYKMREVEVDGASYLAVLNTDYRGQYGDGSLHFYSLANPTDLSLEESLSVRIPSNASDFFYDETTSKLFVLSRNTNQILIFEPSGSGFSPKMVSDEPSAIDLASGPQSLAYFEITEESKRLLAISSYAAGRLQFFDIDGQQLLSRMEIEALNASEFEPSENLDERIGGTPDAPSALFEARPRRESITSFPIQDKLGLRIASRSSGLGEIVYLGGNKHTFAVASTLNSSLFNFKFLGFESTSNFFWDLNKFDRGYRQGELSIPGSRDRGFPGIAKDGNGSVFLTSRADSSIYKIDVALMEASPQLYEFPAESGELIELNTSVFQKDQQAYRLPINFDSNVTDKVFPRLFHLVVNNQTAGGATRAYILGLQNPRKKESLSRLYLVDLSGNSILATYDFASGDYPQYLFLLEDENLLYVSVAGANKIRSFDVSADSFAITQELGMIQSSKK